MQDEMVAELKAAGSSVAGGVVGGMAGDGADTTFAANSGYTEVASCKSQATADGMQEWSLPSRASVSKPTASFSSSAKKRPGNSQAKRGRVGGRGGGKGRRRQSRTAGNSIGKGGRAKKPTRTRLSISDFDGVSQVLVYVLLQYTCLK